jgi:hypothetical protein
VFQNDIIKQVAVWMLRITTTTTIQGLVRPEPLDVEDPGIPY